MLPCLAEPGQPLLRLGDAGIFIRPRHRPQLLPRVGVSGFRFRPEPDCLVDSADRLGVESQAASGVGALERRRRLVAAQRAQAAIMGFRFLVAAGFTEDVAQMAERVGKIGGSAVVQPRHRFLLQLRGDGEIATVARDLSLAGQGPAEPAIVAPAVKQSDSARESFGRVVEPLLAPRLLAGGERDFSGVIHDGGPGLVAGERPVR